MEGWSDKPLTSSAEDALGRALFASSVSNLIDANHAKDASIVYGLTGPWGSGKTSLLNMVTEQLQAKNSSWIVQSFTPWAANDVGSLVAEFFNVIGSALPGKKWKRAKAALADLARISIPALGVVPLAGPAAAAVSDRALARFLAGPAWQERFDELSATISSSGIYILIVADDVDRLHPDELSTLLKVVRLLGRFPGVDYLLAYDETTISDVLAAKPLAGKTRDRARLFMEKIVQYPIAIPPVEDAHLVRRLNDGLAAVFAEHSRPLEDPDGRISGVRDTLVRRLRTLRAVDRYLAQVRLYLPLVKAGDINDVDVLLLTFIRLHFPSLYEVLPSWKSHLTRATSTSMVLIGNQLKEDETDWDPLFEVLDANERAEAREILSRVFPILDRFSGREGDRRACDSGYFDRYFTYGIPVDDISDVLVGQAVADLATGGDTDEARTLRSHLMDSDPAVATVALTRARNATRELPAELITPSLIDAIVRLLPETTTDSNWFFSPRDSATHWLGEALSRVRPQDLEEVSSTLEVAQGASVDILKAVGYSIPDDAQAHNSVLGRAVAAPLGDAVVEHLEARDDADSEFLFRTAVGLISKFGLEGHLKDRVAESIRDGRATPEDLAARCTGLAYTSRANGNAVLNDFDRALFESFGVPWSPEPVELSERPDEFDVSWPNRRRFAQWAMINNRNEIT